MLFRRELDKITLASLKEKSRKKRAQFFNGSKVELMDELLNAVNGGTAAAMGGRIPILRLLMATTGSCLLDVYAMAKFSAEVRIDN